MKAGEKREEANILVLKLIAAHEAYFGFGTTADNAKSKTRMLRFASMFVD